MTEIQNKLYEIYKQLDPLEKLILQYLSIHYDSISEEELMNLLSN